MADFIESARAIVGRDKKEAFSLEDPYFIADRLGLSGVLYLEKLDETRHVNVLVSLDKEDVVLYDPLRGLKRKPRTRLHLGLYAKPVGRLRAAFARTRAGSPPPRGKDPWPSFEERGSRLETMLNGHPTLWRLPEIEVADLPPLQTCAYSKDCARASLYVLSLWSRTPVLPPHLESSSAERDLPDCPNALESPFPCLAT